MNKKDGFLDLFLHFFLSGSYNLYYLITKRNFKLEENIKKNVEAKKNIIIIDEKPLQVASEIK